MRSSGEKKGLTTSTFWESLFDGGLPMKIKYLFPGMFLVSLILGIVTTAHAAGHSCLRDVIACDAAIAACGGTPPFVCTDYNALGQCQTGGC